MCVVKFWFDRNSLPSAKNNFICKHYACLNGLKCDNILTYNFLLLSSTSYDSSLHEAFADSYISLVTSQKREVEYVRLLSQLYLYTRFGMGKIKETYLYNASVYVIMNNHIQLYWQELHFAFCRLRDGQWLHFESMHNIHSNLSFRGGNLSKIKHNWTLPTLDVCAILDLFHGCEHNY